MADWALQLYEKMRLQVPQPESITYAAVISSLRNGWMADWALQLYAEMRLQLPQPEVSPTLQ